MRQQGGISNGGGYTITRQEPTTTTATTVLYVDNIWPIHSSPLSPEFDTAYIPPIYPKRQDDAIFIELVYFSQGCY